MSTPAAAPEPQPLTLKILQDAVAGSAAALRCRRKLQPAGGPGDKVFPPTFAGAVYAIEKRRVPGRPDPVTCVLLDSVQSQANRMEQALQDAVDAKLISLPIVEVDFSQAFKDGKLVKDAKLIEDIGRITSLQAPHRLADAILRDSDFKESDGKPVPFRDSSIGKPIGDASPRNATPIYQLCPTALLFGMWDSTGPKGGLGAKFERAIVSEVVAIDAAFGVRVSSRIDPVITKTTGILIYKQASDGAWTPFAEDAAKNKDGKPTLFGKKDKEGKLSSANLGNVLPTFSSYQKGASGPDPLREGQDARQGAIAPGGVTFDHAVQTTTLSLGVLRRLRFPAGDEAKRELAARTVLAAIGLCAATLAFDAGVDLRSRCSLVPTDPATWEILDGSSARPFALSSGAARQILADAVKATTGLGLHWHPSPVTLQPSDKLLYAAAKSQEAVLKGTADDGDEG